MPQNARVKIGAAAAGVHERTVLALSDCVDRQITAAEILFQRHLGAEAEFEASVKLSAAAAQMTANPAALELRRMQMISEVGAENNSTTVLMIPSDFVLLAHTLNDYLARQRPPP